MLPKHLNAVECEERAIHCLYPCTSSFLIIEQGMVICVKQVNISRSPLCNGGPQKALYLVSKYFYEFFLFKYVFVFTLWGTLQEIWRFKNDGHPDISLLYHMIKQHLCINIGLQSWKKRVGTLDTFWPLFKHFALNVNWAFLNKVFCWASNVPFLYSSPYPHHSMLRTPTIAMTTWFRSTMCRGTGGTFLRKAL